VGGCVGICEGENMMCICSEGWVSMHAWEFMREGGHVGKHEKGHVCVCEGRCAADGYVGGHEHEHA